MALKKKNRRPKVEEEEESSSSEDSSSNVNNSGDEESSSSEDEQLVQNGDESSSEGSDDDAEEEDEQSPTPGSLNNNELGTFDLRNLLAFHGHELNRQALYPEKSSKNKSLNDDDKATISTTTTTTVNEEYLMETALQGCTQLITALWQLPKEKTVDAGTMVQLPSYSESRIPRALPPPAPKQETKWEKFAKERGIPLNKNKRTQKVWDEAVGEWKFRHGHNKANSDGAEWPIMEVKGGDDPYADPWEKQREAKRSRVEKNAEQRLRNQERNGQLAKGTTNRVLKNASKIRQQGKQGGQKDASSLPAGVPVDMQSTKTSGPIQNSKLRGKQSTLQALSATQLSTASMGRFDKMRQDEPARQSRSNAEERKKKKQPVGSLAKERQNTMGLLQKMQGASGDDMKERERRIKKGHLAKGTTAYDYDFDDGLGPSSFKKRKGRAGAGKATKMTKKRMR